MTDPWRYRCPECGSSNVRKRIKPRQAKEVVEDTRVRTLNETDKRWFCDHCSTALRAPVDAKTGEKVKA